MALSVAQYAQVATWFSSTTPRSVTGLSWSAGDIIVAVSALESSNLSQTLATPTNANLTFTLRASNQTGGGNEAWTYLWTATAASSQSSQSISFASNATGGQMFGGAVWVISGAPTGVGVNFANLTESLTNLTVANGSVVCYMHADWSATSTFTIATGSGTATERTDVGNGTNYGVYTGEWVGVAAGTFGFGVTSYAGTTISKVAIEITAPNPPAAPSEVRAVAENDGASLVWPVPSAGSSAITDYLIEQNVNSGGWTTITHSAQTEPSYHVTGLTTGDS